MKATITKLDGTRIEAEGTPEEIAKLAGVPAVQYVYIPAACTRPHADYIPWPPVQPFYPAWPSWPSFGTFTIRAGEGWAINNAAGAGGSLLNA